MEQNYNNEIISNKNEQDFQEENKNTNEYITNQEEMNNEQIEEAESDGEDDDDRLTYTLITLDLGNLIHIFEDNNISFVDMLLLTKEDLIELQLEIFQRNRIINFSKLFTKYAKNYSIQEISDFFTFNKQFIFNPIIYDKVSSSNINNDFQNELNNTNINNDNMNNLAYESNNPETNYINTEPNNRNNNTISANSNPNFIFNQSTTNKNYQNRMKNSKNSNPILRPKLKEPQILPQNINGAFNSKIQNKFPPQKINTKKNSSMNNNNNEVQDFFHEKIMNIVEKKKIEKPKINKNIIINKGKMNRKEINKNEEFQKIIEKIGILESSEMNYDLYTKLNLIKNYINMKGDKMTSEDLINISNDINSMINSISNKNNNNNKSIKYK
jgi:hypothetical protein